MEPETLPRIVGKATFKWNSAHEGQREAGKEGINRSQKPIGCTLDDRGGQKVERETGFEPATSTLARSRSTK
jgi:hypothetical protein